MPFFVEKLVDVFGELILVGSDVLIADAQLVETGNALADRCDCLRLDLRLDVLSSHKARSVRAGRLRTDDGEELARICDLDRIYAVAHESRSDVPDWLVCCPIFLPVIECNVAGAPLEALDLAEIDEIDALCVYSLTAGLELLYYRMSEGCKSAVASAKR